MSARPWRQRALFGALAVTVALSAAIGQRWQPADEPAPALPREPHRPQEQARPLPRIELDRLERSPAPADADTALRHPFGVTSWHEPPPPPPRQPATKPLPPPPPTAPPMPFSFMGRYEEDGVRILLLVRGDRLYTVSEGEVIDNTYRVERLAGGQLELTYLPLNIRQTIGAGGT